MSAPMDEVCAITRPNESSSGDIDVHEIRRSADAVRQYLCVATPEYLASTRKVYDFSAAHYASAVGTTVTAAFERPIDRATLNAFAEDLVAVTNALVLDIGCGVGRVTKYLHERGLDVQGLDRSSEMISAARRPIPT